MAAKENKMRNEYRFWLHDLTHNWCYECSGGGNYHNVLNVLDSVPFVAILKDDINRAGDVRDFRYNYAEAYGWSGYDTDRYLNYDPSVLEVMATLACRCEDHIMGDPDLGDRAGIWFFEMMKSLGLDNSDNANFEPRYVENVINRFLDRKYKPNGNGGLFTVDLRGHNMTTMSIWQQLNCWASNYRE